MIHMNEPSLKRKYDVKAKPTIGYSIRRGFVKIRNKLILNSCIAPIQCLIIISLLVHTSGYDLLR